jgi:hypothetical protein
VQWEGNYHPEGSGNTASESQAVVGVGSFAFINFGLIAIYQ